jgi:hypothetical protein
MSPSRSSWAQTNGFSQLFEKYPHPKQLSSALQTAINAYVLDAYPKRSGEVAAWINFGRTLGGFIITYEQIG